MMSGIFYNIPQDQLGIMNQAGAAEIYFGSIIAYIDFLDVDSIKIGFHELGIHVHQWLMVIGGLMTSWLE